MDIVRKAAFELKISNKKSKNVVDTLIEILKRTLESGEYISVREFGKLWIKEETEREDIYLKSNIQSKIPAHQLIFKCSPKLHDKIQRVDMITSMGLDPDAVIELIDFANKITPHNWVIYEYGSFPELKPGNLYIQVFFANNDNWPDFDVSGRAVRPMKFFKISDIANFELKKVQKYLKTKFRDYNAHIILKDIIIDIENFGSKDAQKCLNKYGDGNISKFQLEILLDERADDINDIKSTIVHELAHALVTRQAAQKLHAWKHSFYLVPNQGLDSDPHGPIFQWAYEILIKRVDKIDWMVGERGWDNLYEYQHPEIFNINSDNLTIFRNYKSMK